ncbi:cyanidin 3-O-rutinoside 5-O-glucosyltransferase-like [Dendrobium catenatum]|uniref:cyanidin 3-O-rutinoside 5-O-glucosyltransferase-like n=1 Tax=Dendrobium catenatum TaxID=906689 RepID=UPI0009F3DBFF|nr:cyanidin 3-O-rutinoside 5-O-glucosyltransferase-like [Dendrobium catenatum]
MEKPQQHILVACYPAQGHINPTLRLSKRLAHEAGVRITFSTAVNAHRRMFPNQEAGVLHDDLFAYIPYSNGYDDGFDPKIHDIRTTMYDSKQNGSRSLASIVDDQAARGQPVTCIIYSFFMSWAAEIARERGIPSFLFWIQPATAFAVYWHYFHDYKSILAANVSDPLSVVNLPGLPPMRIRDLPSFVTENSPEGPYAVFTPFIREMFEMLDTEISIQSSKPMVISNTADEMEASAIMSVADEVNIVGIGPLLEDTVEGSLFKSDDKKEYMDWLDRQEEKSVVYVSFGSISVLQKDQLEEIWKGLRRSGRPYLWVVRKDNRWEGQELEEDEDEEVKKGIVVEWCSQGRVLEHKAVGCFVTHCGWNSTVESLLCGVPTVAVPQWTDQLTNAWLMEKAWGTGVRAEVSKDGLMEADELRRCLEIVMGEGERPEEIRRKADMWKEKTRQATVAGGSSHRNLMRFVQEIAS